MLLTFIVLDNLEQIMNYSYYTSSQWLLPDNPYSLMAKQIPELDIIATPTAGQESIIETVVTDTTHTLRPEWHLLRYSLSGLYLVLSSPHSIHSLVSYIW